MIWLAFIALLILIFLLLIMYSNSAAHLSELETRIWRLEEERAIRRGEKK